MAIELCITFFKGNSKNLTSPIVYERLDNILPQKWPILVQPSFSMAAVSKVLHSCFGNVTGSSQHACSFLVFTITTKRVCV